MKKLMLPAILLCTATMEAQMVAGDWQGTLKVGPQELRLALHIAMTPAGMTAKFDSLDQGAMGIPFSSATFSGGKLRLASDAIHASYEGTLSTDGNSITGAWTQGQPLPLEFTRSTAKPAPPARHPDIKPSDIDGAWLGSLDLGAAKLRLVFHIANTADGLTATVDSPDQNANGMPVTSITLDGATLTLAMKTLGATFSGQISADRTAIEGTFTQGGRSFPVTLKPLKDQASLHRNRPQNPVKPYPYREEDVTYENKAGGLRLAATLTIPQGKGPFPAVVLITGSGPQDRDETILDHRPFLVLADYLTRHGIAVLRADDRGTAKSGGNFATATTSDFATDAEAGLAYLKARTEADPKKLGLIGHSEGGLIAPMIAARNPDVAFIVMLAGTGVRGDELLVAQVAAIAESRGSSHEAIDSAAKQESEVIKLVLSNAPDGDLPAAARPMRSPWFREFLTYDPAPALRKVKCPVLALNGSKDTQVPPAQNLPAIRKALEEGGNKSFETVELPGLNHLFQTAKTGSPLEYGDIGETLAPAVLRKVGEWLGQR